MGSPTLAARRRRDVSLRAVGSGAATEVDVSVIVPSYNAAGTIERCLGALQAQDTSASCEVIVVDSGTDSAAELVAARFPEVRLLKLAERAFAGHARNLGAREARGSILAFTDADCVAEPGWIEAIRAAHREPFPVIGGVVANANPTSRVGRAYYFTEFNRWLPGSPPGPVADMPGCCWSMKRSAYDRYGPFIEGTYCSDTAFHWRMAADRHQPHLDPAIVVAHTNPTAWRHCLAHEVLHGRSFARVRVAERRMGRAAALLRAATAPLLPWLLFYRAVRNAAASPGQLPGFVAAAPLVFVAMAAWSYGEMTGYRPERR
jgi:GT2 family glycosyltransferase